MRLSTQAIDPQRIIVNVDGRLDAETCNQLKQAFHDYVANGVRHVTVEMSQVAFIDSSGLSALISGLKTLRQSGGTLNLAAVGAQVRTALRLTLLDTVLPIFETVEEATGRPA